MGVGWSGDVESVRQHIDNGQTPFQEFDFGTISLCGALGQIFAHAINFFRASKSSTLTVVILLKSLIVCGHNLVSSLPMYNTGPFNATALSKGCVIAVVLSLG